MSPKIIMPAVVEAVCHKAVKNTVLVGNYKMSFGLFSKRLCIIAIILTFISHSAVRATEMWHGTVAVFVYDDNGIAMSIDSLSTNTQTGETRHDCKVSILDDKIAFLATGIGNVVIERKVAFDIVSIASAAFHQSGDDIERTAVVWADGITQALNALSLNQAQLVKGIPSTDGVFAGIGKDGQIRVYIVRINKYGDGKFEASTPITMSYGIRATLHNEIIEEIAGGRSPRSRDLKNIIRAYGPGGDSSGFIATETANAIIDWANDPVIGKPVATVVLRPTDRWRWFSRPEFCPEK